MHHTFQCSKDFRSFFFVLLLFTCTTVLGGDPASVTSLSHRSKLRNNEGRSLHQYHDCLVFKSGLEGKPLEAKFSNFKSITVSMTHFLSIMPNTRWIRITYISVLYLHLACCLKKSHFLWFTLSLLYFPCHQRSLLRCFQGCYVLSYL